MISTGTSTMPERKDVTARIERQKREQDAQDKRLLQEREAAKQALQQQPAGA